MKKTTVSGTGSEPRALDGQPREQALEQATESATQRKEKPPTPQNCRSFTRKKVADALPAIAQTFVDKAIEGSVPHMTFLSDFCGFDRRPIPAPPPRRKGKSLAQRLLDELEEYEAIKLASEIKAQPAAESVEDGTAEEGARNPSAGLATEESPQEASAISTDQVGTGPRQESE